MRYATYIYDASGKAVDEIYPAAGVNTNRYQLNFDPSGLKTTVTDPLGSVRTYNFTNILGVLKQTSQDQPGGSGCGAASSNLGYDANGNVAFRVDFNGHRTNYAYDLTRNLETLRTEGLGNTGSATAATRSIATTWHATWRLPIQIIEKNAAGTALRQIDLVYDNRGNKTSQSIKDIGLGITRTTTWTYTYSAIASGQIDQLVIKGPRTDVVDSTTITFWPADATCAGAGTGYDKGCRGQIKQIANAVGQITQYNRYNQHGQVEQIIDPNGLTTNLTYDARQRLTQRSNSDGVKTETTQYQYDGVGQLIQTIQPDNSTITYTYDGAHRLTTIADSLGNSIAYTLDAIGNRTGEQVKDPAGTLARQTSRIFDALNRLQTVTGGTQ